MLQRCLAFLEARFTVRPFAPLALAGIVLACTGGVAHAAPNPRVVMVIENRGSITLELAPKAAPKTVAHFLALTNKKFYDGVLFHRVEPNFVAQAGDPGSKKYKTSDLAGLSSEDVGAKYHLGGGGSGSNVPLEAKMPHDKATIGLARSDDPNSGDSQFYLNLQANHMLDNKYCVFGKIVKGADVMEKIQIGDKIKSIRVVPAAKK